MNDSYLSNLTNCKYARCNAKREMTWWDLILKEIWWSASILTRSKMPVILSRDTPSQLWIKLHRNQSNLLFIRSSIHLTDHVEMIENNPEIASKRDVEISSHDWNAAASRNRKLEKPIFAHLTFLILVTTRSPHKVLNVNLSFLRRSSSSDF